jgi:predicted enzyme related to lactoylglutathione lyase
MHEELAAVAPELFVPDVDAVIPFYVDVLGFTLVRTDPPGGDRHVFALLMRGPAVFMLAHESLAGERTRPRDGERRGRAVHIRLMVADADAAYERVRAHGASIVMPIGDRDYGLRDFIIEDPNGFDIRIAAPLPVASTA